MARAGTGARVRVLSLFGFGRNGGWGRSGFGEE